MEGQGRKDFGEKVGSGRVESIFHFTVEYLAFCIKLGNGVQDHDEGIQSAHDEKQTLEWISERLAKLTVKTYQ